MSPTDLFGSEDSVSTRNDTGGIDAIHATGVRLERGTDWKSLFSGYARLRAVTYSASVEAILAVSAEFDSVDIVIGSERVMGKELASLQAASEVARYDLRDALADQKSHIEHLLRPALKRSGRALAGRVAEGAVRLHVMRGAPLSHEKMFLLDGANDRPPRVITGSANLGVAALSGWQRELFFVFDDEEAIELFETFFERDRRQADPVPPDLVVVPAPEGADVAETDLREEQVPMAASVLNAGEYIVDHSRPAFTGDEAAQRSLREASRLGRHYAQVELDRDKHGRQVVMAKTLRTFHRSVRTHAATDSADTARSGQPHGVLDLPGRRLVIDGETTFDFSQPPDLATAGRDAGLLRDLFEAVDAFYNDREGLKRAYWILTAWLYAAPFLPSLRAALVRHGGEPWAAPIYTVMYGRANAGKTTFAELVMASMMGRERTLKLEDRDFTASRTLGLRDMRGVLPFLIDDINQERIRNHLQPLAKRVEETRGDQAPVLVTTNQTAASLPDYLRKRLLLCYASAHKPPTLSDAPVGRAKTGIGTAFYQLFLHHFAPMAAAQLEAVADDPFQPPDVIAGASSALATAFAEALGEQPAWAQTVSRWDAERDKTRPFFERLAHIHEMAPDSVTTDRQGRTLIIDMGDAWAARDLRTMAPQEAVIDQQRQFVKLSLAALENEYAYIPPAQRGTLTKLFARLFARS